MIARQDSSHAETNSHRWDHMRLNPFSTETHFYHEFWVWLDYFIDIRRGSVYVRRLMTRVCTILIPTWVSEVVWIWHVITRIDMKMCPSAEGVNVTTWICQSMPKHCRVVLQHYNFSWNQGIWNINRYNFYHVLIWGIMTCICDILKKFYNQLRTPLRYLNWNKISHLFIKHDGMSI